MYRSSSGLLVTPTLGEKRNLASCPSDCGGDALCTARRRRDRIFIPAISLHVRAVGHTGFGVSKTIEAKRRLKGYVRVLHNV